MQEQKPTHQPRKILMGRSEMYLFHMNKNFGKVWKNLYEYKPTFVLCNVGLNFSMIRGYRSRELKRKVEIFNRARGAFQWSALRFTSRNRSSRSPKLLKPASNLSPIRSTAANTLSSSRSIVAVDAYFSAASALKAENSFSCFSILSSAELAFFSMASSLFSERP